MQRHVDFGRVGTAVKHLVNTRPDNDNGRHDVFIPGDRVVMTSRALRSMGVHALDCVTRAWTVQACLCDSCRSGRLVCTDQPAGDGCWRHIACVSLRHAGQPAGNELPLGRRLVAGRWVH